MAEATYTYGDLAAWYSKHGGTERGREQVKQPVPNPDYDPELPVSTATVNPKTIMADAIKITAADGSTIVVQENPAADANAQPTYTVHEHLDAAPSAASATAARTPNQTADTEAQAAQDLREKQFNQARAADDDPMYETHAEREKRLAAKTAAAKTDAEKAAATARTAATGATKLIGDTTYQQQPDGTWKPAIGLPADPNATKAKYSQVKQDEADGSWWGLTPQGTWEKTEGGPGKAPDKPDVRPDGKGGFIRVKPDGTVESVTPQEAGDPTFVGTPPPYVPKVIADDLQGYSKQLSDAVKAGTITPARATALMDARLKSAQSAVDNELDAAKTTYQGGINQRTQDVSLANQRLSTSATNFNTAADTTQKLNATLSPGSDAGGRAFLAMRELARRDAEAYGGLKDIPQVQVPPALQRAAGITIQSPDGTVVTVPHPSGGDAAAVPSTPQPPSPGMNPAQLLGSMGAPSTGFASLDAAGQQIMDEHKRPPMTFDSMEQTFRDLGMDEDAIQQSRRNFMGAAA